MEDPRQEGEILDKILRSHSMNHEDSESDVEKAEAKPARRRAPVRSPSLDKEAEAIGKKLSRAMMEGGFLYAFGGGR